MAVVLGCDWLGERQRVWWGRTTPPARFAIKHQKIMDTTERVALEFRESPHHEKSFWALDLRARGIPGGVCYSLDAGADLVVEEGKWYLGGACQMQIIWHGLPGGHLLRLGGALFDYGHRDYLFREDGSHDGFGYFLLEGFYAEGEDSTHAGHGGGQGG